METLDIETVKSSIDAVLAKFLGTPVGTFRNPVLLRRSTWNSNPLFHGSYSFAARGATVADRETLAAPLMMPGTDTVRLGQNTSK